LGHSVIIIIIIIATTHGDDAYMIFAHVTLAFTDNLDMHTCPRYSEDVPT